MESKIKILSIIFLVLVVLVAVKNYWPRGTNSPYLTATTGISAEKITQVSVGNIQLIKQGDIWKVGNRLADKFKIENLLGGLLPKSPPDVVSDSESRYGEFGTTKESGTDIKLAKLEVLLGKGASGGGVYAKLVNGKEVYLLGGVNTSQVATSAAFWTDKTIMDTDVSKISKLDIKNGNREVILVQKDGKWLDDKSKQIPSSEIDSVVNNIVSLQATAFPEERNINDYSKIQELSLTVEYNNTAETLDFFRGKDDYLVRRNSDKSEYIVASSFVNSVETLVKGI